MNTHIFIDGANVFHSIREINFDIDYHKLARFLAQGDSYTVSFYTGVPDQPAEKEQKFLSAISKLPHFHIHTRHLINNHEKGVDVEIATDMVEHCFENRPDNAILVSGDADLIPAVESLQEHGIPVTVAAFAHSSSHELKAATNEYIELSEHLDELALQH